MKKCLTIWLLVLSMITIMLPVVAASDKAVFDICVPSELPKAGETFEITVELSNNPGFCAIQFTLSYDNTIMECKRAEIGEMLDGASLSVTNPKADTGAIVSVASLDAIEGDGEIASYRFVAKEDITEFDFNLKNVSLSDFDGNAVSYHISGASEDESVSPEKETPSELTPQPVPDEELTEEDSQGGVPVEPNPEAEQKEPISDEKNDEPEDIDKDQPVQIQLFSDISGHWAETYVNTAAQKGLFKGDDEGRFSPDDNITRAQFVTVLWRMSGSPSVNEETPFEDIDDQIDEFKSAIAWGYFNGYINGLSETAFDPDGLLTREAGMKILHCYSGDKSGGELLFTAIYDGAFEDSKLISEWAKPSMYWGVYNELISGTSETMLSPKDTATRAQLAKILVNYIDTYSK
ncbi:MAG: S-layer homology domain-containing protein [Clostridia bacterium]|nr:S-layer homology domain-containing protein [Clostridia bacterium]